jgi:hypothetical protein
MENENDGGGGMSSNPYHYTPERGKWLRLEAREMEQRKREHALGCQVCFDMLDSESCDAYQRALLKDEYRILGDTSGKGKSEIVRYRANLERFKNYG